MKKNSELKIDAATMEAEIKKIDDPRFWELKENASGNGNVWFSDGENYIAEIFAPFKPREGAKIPLSIERDIPSLNELAAQFEPHVITKSAVNEREKYYSFEASDYNRKKCKWRKILKCVFPVKIGDEKYRLFETQYLKMAFKLFNTSDMTLWVAEKKPAYAEFKQGRLILMSRISHYGEDFLTRPGFDIPNKEEIAADCYNPRLALALLEKIEQGRLNWDNCTSLGNKIRRYLHIEKGGEETIYQVKMFLKKRKLRMEAEERERNTRARAGTPSKIEAHMEPEPAPKPEPEPVPEPETEPKPEPKPEPELNTAISVDWSKLYIQCDIDTLEKVLTEHKCSEKETIQIIIAAENRLESLFWDKLYEAGLFSVQTAA